MTNFYNMILIRIKAEDGSYSPAIYSQEADNTIDPKDWAYQKFFAVLSSNWIDTTFSYVAGYIVRSDGVVIESKVRDSRSE